MKSLLGTPRVLVHELSKCGVNLGLVTHRQTTRNPRNPLIKQQPLLYFLRRAAAGTAAVAASGARALLDLWLGAMLRARLERRLRPLGAQRAL